MWNSENKLYILLKNCENEKYSSSTLKKLGVLSLLASPARTWTPPPENKKLEPITYYPTVPYLTNSHLKSQTSTSVRTECVDDTIPTEEIYSFNVTVTENTDPKTIFLDSRISIHTDLHEYTVNGENLLNKIKGAVKYYKDIINGENPLIYSVMENIGIYIHTGNTTRYSPDTQNIYLSTVLQKEIEPTFSHEFAHAIHHMLSKRASKCGKIDLFIKTLYKEYKSIREKFKTFLSDNLSFLKNLDDKSDNDKLEIASLTYLISVWDLDYGSDDPYAFWKSTMWVDTYMYGYIPYFLANFSEFFAVLFEEKGIIKKIKGYSTDIYINTASVYEYIINFIFKGETEETEANVSYGSSERELGYKFVEEREWVAYRTVKTKEGFYISSFVYDT